MRSTALRTSLLPALLLALASCAPLATRTASAPAGSSALPTGFPARCAPDEVQVMLLGTYAFPGNAFDAVKESPDDMLSLRRQEELQELAARLADWAPQQVAVDWPFALNDTTAARYRRYAAGASTSSRNEGAQVGFRVARRLGHADVLGFGQPWTARSDSADALFRRRPDLRQRVDSTIRARQREADSLAGWRRDATVTEQLRALNSDGALHGGHSAALFGGFLEALDGDNGGGADVISDWYARNARMAQNLTRLVQPGTRRVLALVHADHVPALRSILDESPRYCPVSPLPFLR